jgi:hypothetical protein
VYEPTLDRAREARSRPQPRIEHDRAADGGNTCIEVPHAGGKVAAISQDLGIARRERPLVRLARLREVEASIFRNER